MTRPKLLAPKRCLCLVVLVLAGCKEEPKSESKPERQEDGGAANLGPAVDPNIAKAVAQAARGNDTPTGSMKLANAPPESGVFAPGEADKHIGAGKPTTIAVGSEGTAPKISLASRAPRPGTLSEAVLQLSVRTGPRSALPTIDFSVSFDVTPPKAESAGSPTEVTARVTAAKLAADQPGRLPEGVDKEIAKFKGSRVQYQVAPDGSGYGFSAEPAQGLEGGLARVVRSLGEVLALVHLPYPKQPVGTGAYWMVSSRERYTGADVLSYRMVKLEKIEAGRATLSVNTKRYVAGGQVDFPGLPPHKVDQYQGMEKGEIVVSSETGALVEGEFQQGMIAVLAPDGEVDKRLNVQFDVIARVVFTGGH
jgi:hypothetical protein